MNEDKLIHCENHVKKTEKTLGLVISATIEKENLQKELLEYNEKAKSLRKKCLIWKCCCKKEEDNSLDVITYMKWRLVDSGLKLMKDREIFCNFMEKVASEEVRKKDQNAKTSANLFDEAQSIFSDVVFAREKLKLQEEKVHERNKLLFAIKTCDNELAVQGEDFLRKLRNLEKSNICKFERLKQELDKKWTELLKELKDIEKSQEHLTLQKVHGKTLDMRLQLQQISKATINLISQNLELQAKVNYLQQQLELFKEYQSKLKQKLLTLETERVALCPAIQTIKKESIISSVHLSNASQSNSVFNLNKELTKKREECCFLNKVLEDQIKHIQIVEAFKNDNVKNENIVPILKTAKSVVKNCDLIIPNTLTDCAAEQNQFFDNIIGILTLATAEREAESVQFKNEKGVSIYKCGNIGMLCSQKYIIEHEKPSHRFSKQTQNNNVTVKNLCSICKDQKISDPAVVRMLNDVGLLKRYYKHRH